MKLFWRMGQSRFWSKVLRKPWGFLISLVLFLVLVEFRVMWQQFSADSVLLDTSANDDDDDDGARDGIGDDSRVSSRLRQLDVLQQGYSFDGLRPNRFHDLLPVSPRLPGRDWKPGVQGGGGGGRENQDAPGGLADGLREEEGNPGWGDQEDALLTGDNGGAGGEDEAKREGEGGVVVGQWHVDFVKRMGIQPHNKWIVLDVTSGNCGKNPLAPSGWRILLTGNSSQLNRCRTPWCVRVLPNVTKHDGSGDPSPLLGKTLAYLAAVSSGAQFILEADCTVSLKDAVSILQVSSKGKDHGLMHNGTLLFNPYAHLGDWSAVPRALVTRGGDSGKGFHNSWLYYLRDFDNSVLVKHGLSELSQDVRLVGGASLALEARFDPSAPPVFLGQRSFSPAVPTSSLYRQKAFWALVLPCQSRGPRCQVLRQLIAQRLFRELDAYAGYYRLTGVTGQLLSPLMDSPESGMSPADVRKLATFLDRWRCHEAWKFFVCMESLANDLQSQGGFISQHERSVLRAWVAALRNIEGVMEPDRVHSPWRGYRKVSEIPATLGTMTSRLQHEGAEAEKFIKSCFVGVVAAAAANCSSNTSRTSCNDKQMAEAVKQWFPVAQWKRPVIEDVVLVVVFNNDRFLLHNLPFLETMHRPFFKNIVYCVSNVEGFLNEKDKDMLRHVTLVEGMRDQWFMMYECLTSVARMNFQGVRGYLQIGDDTLLNTWRLFNASLDAIWIPFGFTTIQAEEPTHPWGWYWWPKYRGRPSVLSALSRIERLSGLSQQELLSLDPNYNRSPAKRRPLVTFTETMARSEAAFPPPPRSLEGSERYEEPSQKVAAQFLKLYYGNRMCGLVKHRAIDLFYIPQTLAPDFVSFSQLFLEQHVLIELAVPVIHYGLAKSSQVNYVKASSLWDNDRISSYEHYDQSITFLHPFKMKAEMSQKKAMGFFRDMYMKTLFTQLSKRVRG